jgi:hypothetical protein
MSKSVRKRYSQERGRKRSGSPGSQRVQGPEAPTGEKRKAVRVWLLGGFRVSVGPRAIEGNEWRLRKTAALVKLHALAPGHRLHREQAMDLLWPGSGRKAASNNLRQDPARRILDPAAGSRYLASARMRRLCCARRATSG